ncbi:aspartate--tRNA ligase [bacterium]|nr:aspartate--tRNA ligase [bacterium]
MNSISAWKRTIECGLVNKDLLNKEVILNGWVSRRRDHGGLIFIDLRDRTGISQVVFNSEIAKEAHKAAEALRSEFVISVKGKVIDRSAESINDKMPTGKWEIAAESLTILSESKTLPFQLEDAQSVDEEIRLRYRYLDLRRFEMQHRLALRSMVTFSMREFFIQHGFLEIETPILTKNSPEGAREFLVPSRLHHGSFYALPQSPQLYKQLLMAGGLERYFQIARCFRDEDLRADRQPEFTQLDVEMSFVDAGDIRMTIEKMLQYLFKKIFEIEIKLPLPTITYDQAFAMFGSDKPDLRFGMSIHDVTSLFSMTELTFLKETLAKGGKIGAVRVKDKEFTRSELDGLVKKSQELGSKGLLYVRWGQDGVIESPVAKFLPDNFFEQMGTLFKDLKKTDTLFFVAGSYKDAWTVLGRLRLHLGEMLKLIQPHLLNLLWVVDFPLLEWDEKEKRFNAMHHPFTAPQPGWENLKPEDIKAQAYDIVCNGMELGGGSIRIHDTKTQEKVFQLLGLNEQQMQDKFGFLLESFDYGFPPLGGIALGLDRFIMLLANASSIRDVIAFPKTSRGYDVMMQAPTVVDQKTLKDYGLAHNKNRD